MKSKAGFNFFQGLALAGGLVSSALFFLILGNGQYQIPRTNFLFQWPCTFLFLILAFWTLYSFAENPKNFSFLKISTRQWFVFLWMLYLINFRWRGSGDTVAASVEPFAILQHGNLDLSPFFGGNIQGDVSQVYAFHGNIISKYSDAAGIFLTPFYLITGLAGVHQTDLLCHQLQKMGASCMVALSAYFLLKVLDRLVAHQWAVIFTIAYALGTASFSTSSQAIWQHGPSQLFICLGLYWLTDSWMDKKDGWFKPVFFGGLCWATAVWCRYTDLLVYGGVFAWFAFYRLRQMPVFLLGSLPAFVILAWDNYYHSGIIWQTGYGSEQFAFTASWWQGPLGILFSPGRGLLFFSPFVIFSFWSLLGLGRKEWRNSYGPFFAAAILANLFLYGLWYVWGGGWCYGSRLTADLTPLLVFSLYPLVPKLQASRRLGLSFIFLVGLSILVQAPGVFLGWWWEDGRVTPWTNNPIIYLLGQLGSPEPIEQWLASWAMLILLLLLMSWFLKNWIKNQTGLKG